MAILPTSYEHRVTIDYGGVGLPRGAASSFYVQTNSDAGNWRAAIQPLLLGLANRMSADCQINGYSVKTGPEATGPTVYYPYLVPGGYGTQPVAPNTSVLVRLIPGGVSGRFSGRMFLPGYTEAQCNPGGLWEAALTTQITSKLEEFRTALGLAGAWMGVVHKDGVPAVCSPVEHISVQRLAATQRRRMRR